MTRFDEDEDQDEAYYYCKECGDTQVVSRVRNCYLGGNWPEEVMAKAIREGIFDKDGNFVEPKRA